MDKNLGNVIKNATARAYIYGTYVVLGVLIGATQIGFASIEGLSQPTWLTVTLAVYGYLGIPVGGLAAVNSEIVARANLVTVEKVDSVTADTANVTVPSGEVVIDGAIKTDLPGPSALSSTLDELRGSNDSTD